MQFYQVLSNFAS